jgi:hypothetical protein
MYVERLSVGQSSTLDLNLFHLYARAQGIEGTIVGGAINPIPDGGLLSLTDHCAKKLSFSEPNRQCSISGRHEQEGTEATELCFDSLLPLFPPVQILHADV